MSTQELAAKNFQVAIVHQKGGPFQIETAHITPPRHDEVLVRVIAIA